MDNPIQKWLLAVMKRVLGVRGTTSSWCDVWECGLEPLQFNWFRAAMRLYNSTIPLPNATLPRWGRFCKLTCNWALGLLTAGPPTFLKQWKAWHTRTCSNKSCWTVSLLISVGLSWTVGTDIYSFGHLSLIATLESATAKRLLITSGAHCLHNELWLPILPIGFPGTCFLTFLEMSFAVWLVSDFASTPFALKLQLEIPPLPLLATYVRLMIMSRKKSMFSFTACTLKWFLSAEST